MKTLKDIFVSKEIAKKLKGIGFSEPCIAYYLDSETYKRLYVTNVETDGSFTALGDTLVIDNHNYEDEDPFLISAPTYEQTFKWFREKGYHIIIDKVSDRYGYFIRQEERIDGEIKTDIYEQAREQAILKTIEIYKTQ